MLKQAGVRLVAVSYDEPKILFEFGKQHKIAYALLSDPDSKAIEAFGIRNKEAKGSRIDGVPYPGTFLVDSEGVIRAKIFYEGYKKRHEAEDIVAAVGKLAKRKPSGSDDAAAGDTATADDK